MKPLATAVVALGMLVASPTAEGADWTFKRSYHTHSPQWGVEKGVNRFARGPYYSQPSGAIVRYGYRNLNSHLSVRGRTWDHLNVFESWIQFGEQF